MTYLLAALSALPSCAPEGSQLASSFRCGSKHKNNSAIHCPLSFDVFIWGCLLFSPLSSVCFLSVISKFIHLSPCNSRVCRSNQLSFSNVINVLRHLTSQKSTKTPAGNDCFQNSAVCLAPCESYPQKILGWLGCIFHPWFTEVRTEVQKNKGSCSGHTASSWQSQEIKPT